MENSAKIINLIFEPFPNIIATTEVLTIMPKFLFYSYLGKGSKIKLIIFAEFSTKGVPPDK